MKSARPLPILLATILLHAGSLSAQDSRSGSPTDKPNILWITSEDNGISWVSCYGGTNAKTPAIDQLAREGFRYEYCFDNAAVCAPTRSSWITGMYAISNGTQPMRSRNEIPHDRIPYYPDLLRKAGYHTSNPGKTDYNIGAGRTRSAGMSRRARSMAGDSGGRASPSSAWSTSVRAMRAVPTEASRTRATIRRG